MRVFTLCERRGRSDWGQALFELNENAPISELIREGPVIDSDGHSRFFGLVPTVMKKGGNAFMFRDFTLCERRGRSDWGQALFELNENAPISELS